MTDRSIQERFVRELSENLLGNQAVFHPNHYRNGTREPADLVWVSGRCVVIVYMTSGNQAFEKKRQHNHWQMHRWLRHWRQGETLRGGSGFDLAFTDVDYIVGLSVVGGRGAGNVFEPEQVQLSHQKISSDMRRHPLESGRG